MRHYFIFTLLLCFALIAVGQSRVDSYDPATFVGPTTVHLSQLDDGGWSAMWCGNISSLDGGATIQGCTRWFELKAAVNQNRAAALQNAGTNRWLAEFNFSVDAGVP